MDNQNTQPGVAKNNTRTLYIALGISVLAVILLCAALFNMNNNAVNQKGQAQAPQQSVVAPTVANDQQTAVTPATINNKQDIDNALKQVDSTDPGSVSKDLDQNTTDSSQFSQ